MSKRHLGPCQLGEGRANAPVVAALQNTKAEWSRSNHLGHTSDPSVGANCQELAAFAWQLSPLISSDLAGWQKRLSLSQVLGVDKGETLLGLSLRDRPSTQRMCREGRLSA